MLKRRKPRVVILGGGFGGLATAKALGDNVEVVWLSPADNDGENGIVAVHLNTPSGVVRLD